MVAFSIKLVSTIVDFDPTHSPKTHICPCMSNILAVLLAGVYKITVLGILRQSRRLSLHYILQNAKILCTCNVAMSSGGLGACSQRETISRHGGARARPTRAFKTLKLKTIKKTSRKE